MREGSFRKYLPCNYENPSSVHRTHIIDLSIVERVCKSSAVKTEPENLSVLLATYLAELVNCIISEIIYLKNNDYHWERYLILMSGLLDAHIRTCTHIHAHAYTRAHTYMLHIYTQKLPDHIQTLGNCIYYLFIYIHWMIMYLIIIYYIKYYILHMIIPI